MAYHRMESIVDQHLTEDMANYQLSRGSVSVGYYVNVETRRSIVHSHPYYEYILVRKGTPEYQANGSRFSLRPDELLLIAPRVPHAMFCRSEETSYERVILQINADFMKQALDGCGLRERFLDMPPLYIVRTEAVYHWGIPALLERFNTSAAIEDAALRESLYRSQLMELMLIIESIGRTFHSKAPRATSSLIAEVTAFIQEHYRESELNVAQIAQRFFVSREHLSRTFREYTGESISGYLTDLRMQAFRGGLLEEKKILNACLESGFSDYSSFVKSFRKLYGVTPMEYREQLRAAVGQLPGTAQTPADSGYAGP